MKKQIRTAMLLAGAVSGAKAASLTGSGSISDTCRPYPVVPLLLPGDDGRTIFLSSSEPSASLISPCNTISTFGSINHSAVYSIYSAGYGNLSISVEGAPASVAFADVLTVQGPANGFLLATGTGHAGGCSDSTLRASIGLYLGDVGYYQMTENQHCQVIQQAGEFPNDFSFVVPFTPGTPLAFGASMSVLARNYFPGGGALAVTLSLLDDAMQPSAAYSLTSESGFLYGTDAAQAPEPGAGVLLAVGGIAAIGLLRRR